MNPAPPVTTSARIARREPIGLPAATFAPMPGLFVTLEGIDRSGKTTQAQLLCEALGRPRARRARAGRHRGRRARARAAEGPGDLVDRAHGGAAVRRGARRARRGGDPARRSRRGKIVISDRFLDSSLAYQGGARGLGVEEVAQVNEFATGGLRPDLTILLDLAPDAAAARARRRGRPLRAGGRRAPAAACAPPTSSLADARPRPLGARRRRPRARRGPPGRAGGGRCDAPGGARVSAPAALAGTEHHPHARMVLSVGARSPARPRTPTSSTARPAPASAPPRARSRPSCWPRARPSRTTSGSGWPARLASRPHLGHPERRARDARRRHRASRSSRPPRARRSSRASGCSCSSASTR